MGKIGIIALLLISVGIAMYIPEFLGDSETVQTLGTIDSIKDVGLVVGAMVLTAIFG